MTRWALVPVEPDDGMLTNVYQEVGGSCHSCSPWNASDDDCRRVFADLIAASPGNALLSEILAARDAAELADLNGDMDAATSNRLWAALAKLGPAT